MGGSQGNEEALKTNLILDNLVKNVSYVQIGLVNTLYVFDYSYRDTCMIEIDSLDKKH